MLRIYDVVSSFLFFTVSFPQVIKRKDLMPNWQRLRNAPRYSIMMELWKVLSNLQHAFK